MSTAGKVPSAPSASSASSGERDELRRLNRTLRALSNSSHAMLRAADEPSYLAEVCRIVVEDCGHAMVWIGFAEDGPDKAVRPVASAGFDAGYLDGLQVTWADTERGRGPTGTAIRTGKPNACRNMQTDPRFGPWRREAVLRGYASSIVFPLLAEGRAFGALTIYSSEPDPFLEDEQRLLEELASDLAYGITSLRARAAHQKAEAELRSREEELREAHRKAAWLARFPEENPDPVMRLGSDLTVVYANEAARGALAALLLQVGGAAPPELAEPARRALTHGRHRQVLVCGERFFSFSFCAVGPEVNAYGQDITDLRLTQDALAASERKYRELAEELQEADRHKDEFLGILSHELRNPLAPIQNALQVLKLAPAGSDSAQRAKDVIGRQAGHLARLVDDLLDVTRISHGKIQLRRSCVEVSGLVARVVEDHRALFTAREVALALIVEGGPLWIDADATRISQAIANVLQNAAKFTNAHGNVSVSVARSGDAAVVRVTDDGVGIPGEVLPFLFQPFRQADESLHRSAGGLGLGLALVKALVEMHGGTVEARSDGVGRGAEFTVSVPLVARIDAPANRVQVKEGRPARLRVLVIDDNRDSADTLREVLELSGHETHAAYDGTEGLDAVRRHRPDVVFCDIGLPGVDGYEVARQIKAGPKPWPMLIALTGYALPSDQREALAAGFDRHLGKPLALEEVEALLERLAAGR